MQQCQISYLILWQRKISNSSDFKHLGTQFFIRNYVGTYNGLHHILICVVLCITIEQVLTVAH
jgi:hypothetical protein